MPAQKQSLFLLLFLVTIQSSHAFIFSASDTMQIFVYGSAVVRNEPPFDITISKHAGITYSTSYPLRENARMYLSMNGEKREGIPFLEEGNITVIRNGSFVTGGVLRRRYGKCRLYESAPVYSPKFEKMVLWDVFGTCRVYKSAEVYHPLFNNWVLWDTYGSGIVVEKRNDRVGIEGGFTVDQDKNRALYLLYRVRHKGFCGLILSGMQSSNDKNRDDHGIIGSEFFICKRIVTLHTVIKYDYITHFYHTGKKGADPAKIFSGVVEGRLCPLPCIDLNLLHYYQNYSREPQIRDVYGGLTYEVMFSKVFGIGYGLELHRCNRERTAQPEIFLLLKPIKNHASIKLSFKTRTEDRVSLPGKWAGSIWLEF